MNFYSYIPEYSQYIIVSDLFAENYNGGAELTTQAILSVCPKTYCKIHSNQVTSELVEKHKNKYWILGNIASLTKDALISIATETKYSVINYDYMFCTYRSQHLHQIKTGNICDCHNNEFGKRILGLYKRAHKVFFMSNGQLNEYKKVFPGMNTEPWNNKLIVQGSTFDDKTLTLLQSLSKKYPAKNNKWFIQGGSTTSWIKNTQGCIDYCKNNNLEYDIVDGLPHDQFLDTMAQYEGLVLMPAGFDTNPRITIEAKLLGLKLVLNENVQQKDDSWFNQENKDLFIYLKNLSKNFWNYIQNIQ